MLFLIDRRYIHSNSVACFVKSSQRFRLTGSFCCHVITNFSRTHRCVDVTLPIFFRCHLAHPPEIPPSSFSRVSDLAPLYPRCLAFRLVLVSEGSTTWNRKIRRRCRNYLIPQLGWQTNLNGTSPIIGP